MKKHHRIFIAINLPPEVKRFLSGYKKKWPGLPARWTTEKNLHITLVFLGYLTDWALGEICIVTKEVVKNHYPFNINLNKISYGPFGKIPPPMIWAGGDKSKELSSLKKDLEESFLEKINFAPENMKFKPHITLARINPSQWRQIEPEERPYIDKNIGLNFTVESIEVTESVLRRTDPEYSIIESHNLK